MRSYNSIYLPLLGTLVVGGCAIWEDDEEIALSTVPPAVMDAARGAVAGVTITEAEVERKDGRTVYELEGMANGVEHEIKVAADGSVLNVKKDD